MFINGFITQYYDKDNLMILGSDGRRFDKLKTLKGVLRREVKYRHNHSKRARSLKIWYVDGMGFEHHKLTLYFKETKC